jgi:Toluene-4-monooxygenase system protein B (TmoB)
MIPMYGFLQGDTLGLLVLAQPEDTAADLCAKLQTAASVRVAPFPGATVIYKGQVMEPATTVRDAKMAPLERFDVVQMVAHR